MSKRKAHWFVAFTPDFWDDPSLSLAEKGLLGILARWCDETLHTDLTIEQICAKANICRQTLNPMLERLRKKGALSWRRFKMGGHPRKLYQIPMLKVLTVGWVGSTVKNLNPSAQKMYLKEMPLEKPTKAKWKSAWKITHFPTEHMSKPHSEIAERNLKPPA